MFVFHREKATIMHKLHLHQQIKLNTGVVGSIKVHDTEIFTLETTDCLPPGTYKILEDNGRVFVDVPDQQRYYLSMDVNGQYRNKGLVLGMEFAFNAFDLKKKGEARELLLSMLHEGIELRVTSYSQTLKDQITDLQEARNREATEAKAKLEEAVAQVAAERDAALSELAQVTKEYTDFATRFKK